MTTRRGITALSLAGSALLPVVVIMLALALAVAAPAVAGGKGGNGGGGGGGKSSSSGSSSKGGGGGSSGSTSSHASSGGRGGSSGSTSSHASSGGGSGGWKSSGSSASGSGGGGARSGGWQSTSSSTPHLGGGGGSSSGTRAGGWAAPHVGGGGSGRSSGSGFSLPRSTGPSSGARSGGNHTPATRSGPPSVSDYRRPSFTSPGSTSSGWRRDSSPPAFGGGSTVGRPSGSLRGGWQPAPGSKPDSGGPSWRSSGYDAAPAPGGSPRPWSGSPRDDKSPSPPSTRSGWSYGGGRPGPGPSADTKPWPGAGTLKPRNPGGDVSPRPGRDKAPRPPDYRDPGGRHARPFPGAPDWRPPKSWRPPISGRISFRAWGDGRPSHPYSWCPRYHHYYYRSLPRYYIFGGWGSGWYDPWWWGNYWWPTNTYTVEVHHYYHYNYDDTIRNAPYYEGAPWMDTELTTTLTDVAVAWTTGDIELFQAHLTPSLPVAIRHDWEQDDPWVLAPPVLLDILVEALDSQTDSQFHFAQVEQMEPGLVWAVAEHHFQLRDEDHPRDATMEFMFRRHDNTWLVEAIVASPENYWWAANDVLDDAARESARLLQEMDQADVSGSE